MLDAKTLAFVGIALTCTIYLLDAYFCKKKHPDEPDYVRPTIPLIGHALNVARHAGKFYPEISKGKPEIFTLPAFNFRIYVTNSRHLTPVVQKHAKTLSFRPFGKVAAERFCDSSPSFIALIDERHGFTEDLFRETRNALAPGQGLDRQNLGMGKSLERFMITLEKDVAGGTMRNLPLYEWVAHTISIAATDGVFGDKNPYRDPKVESSFWVWNKGAGKMAAGLPSIFLRKEHEARAIQFKAFEEYCSNEHHDAADVIRVRESLCDKYNVSLHDKARTIASFNFALLGNTAPTVWWALYDVISRPELLEAIRNEVQTNTVTRSTQPNGDEIFELDVAGLRTRCPLLLSSYQETQRFRTIHAPIRKVVDDTTVESLTTGKRYFLAKGNYVQVPSIPIHTDTNVWGQDANEFNPYRFVKNNTYLPRDQLPESYAFMAWGVAPHVCPARQFASTEAMLLVAMMVLRFNIEDSSGQWVTPGYRVEIAALLSPEHEVYVDVTRREGWQGEWRLKMGESSQKIPLASG